MHPKTCHLLCATMGALSLALEPQLACAQGTAFTYQGQLEAGGQPANGVYDLSFGLWSGASGGAQAGTTVTDTGVSVTNGLFTVVLDFGAQFSGADRWLEIGVRTNGAASFSTLSPRQQLTPAPYAIYGENAGVAATANTVVSGAISAAQLNTLGAPSPGQVLGVSGGNLVWTNPSAAAFGWNLAGNAGTTPGLDFVGTTDNQPLEFHVNGQRTLRLEPGAGTNGAPNLIGGCASNYVAGGIIGATIAGGGETNSYGFTLPNVVTANFGTISGGAENLINGQFASAGGGFSLTANGAYATIGGGQFSTAAGDHSTVGGGYNNYAYALDSTVAGGFENSAVGQDAAVGGGYQNFANGAGAFIGGGGYDGTTFSGNQASGTASVVGGGLGNSATFPYATVGGGQSNTASGIFVLGFSIGGTTVAGGQNNTAGGVYATVGGGLNNFAPGSESVIPGGYDNMASGAGSFAAGTYAQAINNDSFVWSDGSVNPFASTGPNQFLVKAVGGVGINTASPQQDLSINGGMDIDQGNNNNGGLFNNGTPGGTGLTFGSGSGEGIASQRTSGANQYDLVFYTGFGNRLTILNNGNVGIGTASPAHLLQVGNAAPPAYCDGFNWVNASDRNSKKDFTAIAPREVLEKVAGLPITEWQYKVEAEGIRHLGPMAQDFHAAFGLNGSDDKHISTVDEAGVALAAIQGLNQKLEEQAAQLSEKDACIKELEQRLRRVERALSAKKETRNE